MNSKKKARKSETKNKNLEKKKEKAEKYEFFTEQINCLKKDRSVEEEAEVLKNKETIADSLIENIDDRWLEAEHGNRYSGLLERIRKNDVGLRIVHTAVEDVQWPMSNSAQELLKTLENPTNEASVRQKTETALERLGEYDEMIDDLNREVSTSPGDTLDEVTDGLEAIRWPTPVGDELANQYEERLQNLPTDGARLERYTVEQGIVELERAVTETRLADRTPGEWETMVEEFERLQSILEDLMQPGRNGINRGHMVLDVFVGKAELLHERARESHRNGNEDRAEALIEAGVEVQRGVKQLYDDRKIREILQ
jgi:hypothetical protein